MEASREVGRLIEIMAALRQPETGCPWDIEQTFATIAPYTVEEAYEVADAIERRDAEDLREELGDLLLQVVYHSQLADEAGFFRFEDVVEAITTKMIRRHPHVFGDVAARNARSAKGQWERIKAEEKAAKAARRAAMSARTEAAANVPADWQPRSYDVAPRYLDDIPSTFPALTLALKVQEKSARVGFDWEAPEPIKAKIAEELDEFDAAVAAGDEGAAEEELGDLIFSVVNLARYHSIDPEKALRRCVLKFRTRFTHIEQWLAGRGRSLAEASLDEMERLWTEAKTLAPVQPPEPTRISG